MFIDNKFWLHKKIQIVLICDEKTDHRQVADIFDARFPGKNIHQSTGTRPIAKFKSTLSERDIHIKSHNQICIWI